MAAGAGLDADGLIRLLDLKPLPWEGGYYRETWRAGVSIPKDALGAAYSGPRDAGTAIHYLLTPDTLSRMHRLPSAETFHFYMGDPVEMLLLTDPAQHDVITYGPDLAAGECVQFTVPGMVWMGARLAPGRVRAGYALMGTTVAPGFDFDDLIMGDGATLAAQFPAAAELIRALS